MTKAAPRLTKIQAKALDFIRTSLERSGTAPTLRELCAFMGYSAIGSAQDLVAALRRKGFLHTPDKQSARSLVLTPKAIALHEPSHQSTDTTYVIHCLDELPAGSPLESKEDRTGTLRISVSMFPRPYPNPETIFALKFQGDSMVDAGIIDGDWLVVNYQSFVEPGRIVVAKYQNKHIVNRLMKDRNGWYLRPENTSHNIIRPTKEEEPFDIIGEVIASQRIFLA
jgi:repressor LexA